MNEQNWLAAQFEEHRSHLRGVAYRVGASESPPTENTLVLPSYEEVSTDPRAFVQMTRVAHLETNPYNAKRLVQYHAAEAVVINAPAMPLDEADMDRVYGLPYTRRPHPSYGDQKIPAYEVVKDSIQITRGCFGGCAFCSITAHEGRVIQSRSTGSVLAEIRALDGFGPYATERERLVPLRSLDSWSVSEGEPDIRGWEIRTVSGRQLGTVNDLLIDPDANEVVMLDVDLPGRQEHTFVPIRIVQIDRVRRLVLMDSADFAAPEGVVADRLPVSVADPSAPRTIRYPRFEREVPVYVPAFTDSELGLERIYAHVLEGNAASCRVLEKLGLVHEGTRRHHVRKGRRLHDVEMYGVLRDEW